ncbi:MAG: acyl-CoA dehydrogenase family protein [Candidatus Accumulibacter sp.]|jgi:alkylation response protein AidB-like acyl-CoA dehydrogenase|nr:acyl-CoA dehydrogenase family protein [Accumulibacter sp.]
MFLSTEHQQVADMTRRFADRMIRPEAERLDREEAFAAGIYREMARNGLFGITTPDRYGGAGLDNLAYSIVMEELSRGYASVADQCGLVELLTTLLCKYGTEEQRQRWIRPLIEGEKWGAYCITEAGAGSDVSAVRTTAVRKGSGWVLNGSKLWIHNAPVADVAFVLARTDPEAGKRGMSIFIVDCHSPGVFRGPKEHKLGQRSSQIGELGFSDVGLPEEALLGPEGRGFHIMMSVLEKGRVGIGALAVGIIQAALEASIEQAKLRRQFGQAIAEFQAIQFMLADMAKDAEAARLLVRSAALKLDAGVDAAMASSMAKCFAADAAVLHTANAIQIFGGSGYILGYEVERLYRDAKITQIYEGTNQIQRVIIARKLLQQ